MDKHDRPYKCPATGCEKLPGFTYSGGLLRHEREVHNKHGGPRRQLNCPHQNCKRHIGKGFSRQENLNEHLRRVHTDSPAPPQPATMNGGDAETEPELSEVPGAKRKRRSIGTSGPSQEDDEVREELKQLKIENESLRNSLNDLNLQFRVLQQAYIGAVQMQNPHQQQQHHQMQQVQIPQPGSAQPQPQPMATPQMQHAQMQQQPLQQQMHSPVAKFDPIPAQQNQQQAQQVLQQQQQQAQQAAAQGMQRMPAAPMM